MATEPKKYVNVPDPLPKVKRGEKEIDLKDCCIKNDLGDPKGCDCCYDDWNDKLKTKQKEYGKKVETAAQAQSTLIFHKGRRDGLKVWLDDLNQLNENVFEVCDQFELLISQVTSICTNAKKTVQAVELLFCMLRDFYSQIDTVKKVLDDVMKCIKDLNSSVLTSGTGIMKCLEAYAEKLDVILKTKEELIKQIMEAVKMANLVSRDVDSDYGLAFILKEWRYELNCCDKDCTVHPAPTPCPGDEGEAVTSNEEKGGADCTLYPKMTFPVCKDPYKQWVQTTYDCDKKLADDAATAYLKASKEKEQISAEINSLKEAIITTNLKDRCK